MLDKLKFFSSAGMTAGINVNAASITMGEAAIDALPLTGQTYNWTAGRQAGWTTRYGMMPVPGHATNEDGDAISGGVLDGYTMRNLVAAEQTPAAHTTAAYDVYGKRRFLFGAAIVQLPVGTSGAVRPVVYWISSRDVSGGSQLDLLPSTEVIADGQKMGVRSHLEAGVGGGTAVLSYVAGATEVNRTLRAVDRLHTTDLTTLRRLPTGYKKYLPWTVLQTQIQTNLTEFTGIMTATTDPGGTPRDMYFGFPGSPFWNNEKSQKRNISFDLAESNSGIAAAPKKWLNKAYFSTTSGDLTGTKATNRSQSSTANTAGGRLAFSGVSASYTTAGTHTASAQLFARTTEMPVTVPVTAIAMVTDRPLIALINPYLRDSLESDSSSSAASPPPGGNDFVQWVDPTNNFYAPRVYNTQLPSLAAAYTETAAAAGVAVTMQTCWNVAPAFVYGTNTGSGTLGVITTGGGALRANKTYEYAYSIYNALTGKESNVGKPARAFVSADNSAIVVQTPAAGMLYGAQIATSCFPSIPAWLSEGDASVRAAAPVNYLSYRLYYREVGSAEWLFSGEVSFASVYFECFGQPILIGRADAVGEVGGQPAFYNDYSDLPPDDYIGVVSFLGRLFWYTKNTIRFSLDGDIFSYPVRNYATSPEGSTILGVVVHYFPGQAAQDGRLVIFTSAGIVEGRFIGNDGLAFQMVRVSPTTEPQALPVPDSDFRTKVRGRQTAFNGRCAVVAENGALYFMGPGGIFRDDGVSPPKRISKAIEPDYFRAYDKGSTDEFFAYYNQQAKEIIFFYRPSTVITDLNPDNYLTKAWVYSLRTENFVDGSIAAENTVIGAWSQYGYECLIDWAQDFNIADFAETAHAPGNRTLIGVRAEAAATVSRPYYHDDECDGGDLKPGYELMVKEIETPDADTMRFVLADGWSASILNAINVGSTRIAVKGSVEYGDMPTNLNVDGFYVVIGKDEVAGTLDIARNGNLSPITATTFEVGQFFPIFVEGVHNVRCVLEPNYLSPLGLVVYILVRFLHILIKPVERKQGTAAPYVLVEWQANHEQSADEASKQLPLYPVNAREETTQILADVPSDKMQAYGQAVRTRFTYNQVAGRWSLFLMTSYYDVKGANEVKVYTRSYS